LVVFFGDKPRRRACGNCEKAERGLRGSFQAAVGIRVLCGFPSAASVSTGHFVRLFSAFVPIDRFPGKISR
jgi:hypothetical protein